MCRACDETPDGAGRRCNRQEGFQQVESDQRNRLRNLANAREALRSGDPQTASNALAHALSAQRALDGGKKVPVGEPADVDGPVRDILVAPSDIERMEGLVGLANRDRKQRGLPQIDMSVTKSHEPVNGDPVMVWEQVNVRLSGASEDDLAEVNTRGVRGSAEKRARTSAVLEASCAAVRLNNGQYASRGEAGEKSVPALVDAYLADAPGGPVRTLMKPTDEDKEMAVRVLGWVRMQRPTSEYLRSLRHSVSEDQMSVRDAGIAASGVSGYLRYRDRRQQQPPIEHSPQQGAPSVLGQDPAQSRWLNQPGDKIMFVARVEKVHPVDHQNRNQPAFLYILRTPDGDMVRWLAPANQGLSDGDEVTMRATVKKHSRFNGEKQTEVYYAQPPQVHPRSA